ncbi:Tic22-like family protein isoform 1 [Striga asiatica]|uniref:Tic22-like family protein isoform 1 n=1 Tax=Striga asiatica TaxID=4170 RepID=A0A5A7R0Y0_STRAF|nr:Tic22-like family protein isoform 1 [Striga asiatica]
MTSTTDTRHHRRRPAGPNLSRLLHAASTNINSLVSPKPPSPPRPSSKIHLPLLLPDPFLSLVSPSASTSTELASQMRSKSPLSPSTVKDVPSPDTRSRLSSSMQISTGKGGGPAFVGQVFSMCDLTGTGLMAVSTHFDIPFLSKRTPEWLKKIFSAVTKSERNGPVFRFFMDLGDAVSYVKQLNIPSGVVGACRLDIAYEHFKEKPHLFQFVPNQRQVKEANKLLKNLPQNDERMKVDGVPVYTPYFFDKNMLDNILEDSMDQHFQALIETRHFQRHGDDSIDDSLTAEAVEEMGESMWDPPEVQEVLDEVGYPTIPLSIISKAAEIQLMYAVDKVLLGNRWMRKATGIQPKFQYMVDSFERKSTASLLRAQNRSRLISNTGFVEDAQLQSPATLEVEGKDKNHDKQGKTPNFQFPFGDWFAHPFSKEQENQQNLLDTRDSNSTRQHRGREAQSSPFIPKITMVGISTGDPAKMSKATLKKTMDDLTKELEKIEHAEQNDSSSNDHTFDDERDPLFVANVGDYGSRTGPGRWVRGGSI